MPLFICKSAYEIKIPEIDLDHRHLVGLINDLYEQMKIGHGYEMIDKVIDQLIDYVGIHFDREESFMRAGNYPAMSDHLAEHDRFRALFEKIRREYLEKGADNYLAIELEKSVYRWWEGHIMKTDMAFARIVSGTLGRGSAGA